jgi:hypothetical protein
MVPYFSKAKKPSGLKLAVVRMICWGNRKECRIQKTENEVQ